MLAVRGGSQSVVIPQPQTKVEKLGLQVTESRTIQQETSPPMRTATPPHHTQWLSAVVGGVGMGGVGAGWGGASVGVGSFAVRGLRARPTAHVVTQHLP
jgi:hypothetical protein